jgi:hypothetical protein
MFIKAWMSITVVGLLLGSPLANAADQKAKISDSFKACQAGCKPHENRDAAAYEGCMIKCNKAEKARTSPEARIVPEKKK